MLLFGGVNLKSYCEGSILYEFCIDDKQCAYNFEDTEAKIKGILAKARESNLSVSVSSSNDA